jgi:hypothetical protein
MNLKELEKLTIENFENHPDLKRRLITYCIATWEDDAMIDDYHLLTIFHDLQRNKELHKLEIPTNIGEPS